MPRDLKIAPLGPAVESNVLGWLARGFSKPTKKIAKHYVGLHWC